MAELIPPELTAQPPALWGILSQHLPEFPTKVPAERGEVI